MADPTNMDDTSDIWFGKVLLRDKFAHAFANMIFKVIASKRYNAQLESLFEYGMRSGIRDYLEHRDPPPPFHELQVERDRLAREAGRL